MVVPNENTWYDPVPQYGNITYVHVYSVSFTVGIACVCFYILF
jgi:hypothetical protein